MPDLPIVIPDTTTAPKDYTLSGTQELALKTVRALIDGTAAGSAFLPTLQLLDPNGHVMWEGATSSTVAAGASADVSWFPGLGSQSSAATGPSALPHAVLRKFGTHLLAPAATYPVEFDDFRTTDSSFFKWVLAAPTNIVLPQSGLYQWWLSLYPDLASDWPAAGAGNINFGVSVTAAGPTDNATRRVFAQYPFVEYETGVAANDGTLVTTMGVKNIQANGSAGAQIVNNTAANWTLGVGSFLYLVRLGDAVTF